MSSAALADAISTRKKRSGSGEEPLRGTNKRRRHKIRRLERRQPQEGGKDASGKGGRGQGAEQKALTPCDSSHTGHVDSFSLSGSTINTRKLKVNHITQGHQVTGGTNRVQTWV